MDFAGVRPDATNLYLTISCFDMDIDGNSAPDVLDKLLPLLTADTTPGWTENQSPPCGGSASLISNADQFPGSANWSAFEMSDAEPPHGGDWFSVQPGVVSAVDGRSFRRGRLPSVSPSKHEMVR